MRDKPTPGRSAEAVTFITVTIVEVIYQQNQRVALQLVANQLSIDKVSAHQILHEKLGMSKEKCYVNAETADSRPKAIKGDHNKITFRVF